MTTPRLMTDPAAIVVYAAAGDATLTLTSARTGKHLTYRVWAPDGDADALRRMVSILHSGDKWAYVGATFRRAASAPWGDLVHTKGSRYRHDTASFMAFDWLWRHATRGQMPPGTEVRHSGRCGRCNHPLTHPDSLDSGIGPDCAAQMGLVRSTSKVLRTAADVDGITRRG